MTSLDSSAGRSSRLLACAALLTAVVGGGLTLLAQSRGASTTLKQTALDTTAKQVLLPAYTDFAGRCDDLAVAAISLTSKPSSAALETTQQAWKAAMLAWRRTQSFTHGPAADLGVSGRIAFWPTRWQSVDRVLKSDRAIDDGYIQELGANAVGLSALEVLLFDSRQNQATRLAAFSGPKGERQRRYFTALTDDLRKKARQVANAWLGPSGYAARFSSGGQQQLDLVVNDLLAAIETGAQARLQTVVDRHNEPQFPGELVEGSASDTSQQGLLALLLGARATFLGGAAAGQPGPTSGGVGVGVDDYLKQLNPAAARRVEAQFKKAIDAVQAVSVPLEQAIITQPQLVVRATEECRALEILIKVEMASSLGVTLTFKSTDGD